MRIAMIGCMVMNREISLLTAKSENIIRVWWLRQGLHDTPDVLRAQLQKTIDEIEQENQALRESQRFQAIVLAYGLCSNGVIGLRSRSLPIIVPRIACCSERCRAYIGTIADGLNSPLRRPERTMKYSGRNMCAITARKMQII